MNKIKLMLTILTLAGSLAHAQAINVSTYGIHLFFNETEYVDTMKIIKHCIFNHDPAYSGTMDVNVINSPVALIRINGVDENHMLDL